MQSVPRARLRKEVNVINRILEPTPTRGPAPSHSPPDVRYAPGISLAKFLGWFSIGLGIAELASPGLMNRVTGVKQKPLLQTYGVREIICGLGTLSSARPAGWMWIRLAGDIMDVATLLKAEIADGKSNKPLYATAAVAGVAVLDMLAAAQLTAAANLEG